VIEVAVPSSFTAPASSLSRLQSTSVSPLHSLHTLPQAPRTHFLSPVVLSRADARSLYASITTPLGFHFHLNLEANSICCRSFLSLRLGFQSYEAQFSVTTYARHACQCSALHLIDTASNCGTTLPNRLRSFLSTKTLWKPVPAPHPSPTLHKQERHRSRFNFQCGLSSVLGGARDCSAQVATTM
jgi:hypothetical protein